MGYAIVLVATSAAFLISVFLKNRLFTPLLGAASVYYPFLFAVQHSIGSAFLLLLFWTVVQSELVLFYSSRCPAAAERLFWNAGRYTETMFRWVETGVLPEGNKRSLVLVHVGQALAFCALALISANFLSLVLGCALLNYMNFYVSRLAERFGNRAAGILMGWNPWSVIRVVSFLWLGAGLSIPALARLRWVGYELRWWHLLPGLVGVVVDLAVKIGVGGPWSRALKARMKRTT